MHEISKGTSAPLSTAVRKAEKTHENSANAIDEARNRKADYENLEKRPVGRATDFEKRISRYMVKEKEERASLKMAMDNREETGRLYCGSASGGELRPNPASE